MSELNLNIVVQESGRAVSSGHVIMAEVPYGYRLKKALKNMGLCYGAMLVFLFLPIPIFHLFIVGGLFLLGIFMFFNTYVDDIEIASGQIACSGCGQENQISKRADTWPFWLKCSSCQKDLRIEKQLN
jgi:chromate transport protein ChrA